MKHGKRGRDRREVDRHHDRSVFRKSEAEEIRGDNVYEVRDDEGEARGIRDEARRHHKGDRGFFPETERREHRDHDRGKDECRPVVREERGHRGSEENDEREEPRAPAAAPARDVERRPLKESGGVEKETDENHCDKGPGRVPDDMPDRRDVTEMHNTGEKRENRAERCAPADSKPPRLPDNESECEDKNRESRKHGEPRLQAASDRLKDLSEGKRREPDEDDVLIRRVRGIRS